jgi:hypothetical protein
MRSLSKIRWRAIWRVAIGLIVIAFGSGIAVPPMAHAIGRACGTAEVLTYHNDAQRTGWNPNEKVLTPGSVKPSVFYSIKTVPLDDQVDAQPLVVADQAVEGHSKGTVVYVVTENNTVYAIDACSGAILKRVNLGPAVPKPLGCFNNADQVGTTGTPVIDKNAQVLYVIAYTLAARPGGFSGPIYQLHKLDLSTLADKPGSPVTVTAYQTLEDGTFFPFNATYQRQRAALLQANGNIYAGFASFCDLKAENSRGWVLGWNGKELSPLATSELTNKSTWLLKTPSAASLVTCHLSGCPGMGWRQTPLAKISFLRPGTRVQGHTTKIQHCGKCCEGVERSRRIGHFHTL